MAPWNKNNSHYQCETFWQQTQVGQLIGKGWVRWPEFNGQWSKNMEIESEDHHIQRKSAVDIFCCHNSYVNFGDVLLSSLYLFRIHLFFLHDIGSENIDQFWKLKEICLKMFWSEMKCRKLSLLNYGAIRWLFTLGSNISLFEETCQNLSQLVATWQRIKTKWDMNWASNAKIICVQAIDGKTAKQNTMLLDLTCDTNIKWNFNFLCFSDTSKDVSERSWQH